MPRLTRAAASQVASRMPALPRTSPPRAAPAAMPALEDALIHAPASSGATKMIQGLTGMGQYLDAAAKAFAETDTQLAAALQ